MDEKIIARRSFIWNALHAGFNAIQSSVILVAVARTRGLFEAGIITLGFTIAAFTMITAIFGIRNYQVTDVNEEYSFSDYFYVRIITVFLTLITTLAYLLVMEIIGKYNGYKAMLIFEITCLKLVDAFEGLYVGRFQQKGRLDIGSRIATVRIVITTIIIFILIWFLENLQICFLIGIVVSILIDMIMVPLNKRYLDIVIEDMDRKMTVSLLAIGIPLCMGTALHNFLGNAPKYLVDFYLTDELQAISGYIMMPMFVITILNSFLMQPTVKSLGEAWNDADLKRLRVMAARHVLCILLAAILVFISGICIGLPFMSWIYNVELSEYSIFFMLIMIGGSFYTLSVYAMVMLTAMRQQNWVVLGCVVSLIIYACLGKVIVFNNGLMGVSYLYIFTNVILLAFFSAGIFKRIKTVLMEK